MSHIFKISIHFLLLILFIYLYSLKSEYLYWMIHEASMSMERYFRVDWLLL